MENPGKLALALIEVQTGGYLGGMILLKCETKARRVKPYKTS